MNFKRKKKVSKLYKFIQGFLADYSAEERNKATAMFLREVGYPDRNIRGAMFILNEITIPMLLKDHPELKPPTLYGTMQGRRPNIKAKRITSEALGLEVADLYPEQQAQQ